VPAGQPIFSPKSTKTSIKLLLEAQQHKKYAQNTPLDDGISSLFLYKLFILFDRCQSHMEKGGQLVKFQMCSAGNNQRIHIECNANKVSFYWRDL
jgi:hypothetical protein